MYSNHVSSMIFTPVKPLPEILGEPRLRQGILDQIYASPEAQLRFEQLTAPEREALIDFCMGNRSLKITYDPFFRNIMHPVKHPDRLNKFLSQVLQQKVTVKGILPREGVRLSNESSLMIMDLLVELEDGSLINVEIQKVGYAFPIERTFCYGADLLVRQYDRIHALLGENFTYKNMRPVYIIVLMETSPAVFKNYAETYIHRSTFRLDSGLTIDNLMNFIYIPLDIFLEMPHNELTELEAWLYFLGSDNPLHIQRIIEKYPFFKELYRDIIDFRYHPEELIHMFSETLLVADRNTVKLMIDELRQQLSEKDTALSEKDAALSEKDAALSEKDAALSEKDIELSEKDAEIKLLKERLEQLNS